MKRRSTLDGAGLGRPSRASWREVASGWRLAVNGAAHPGSMRRSFLILFLVACGRHDFDECDRCDAPGALRCVDGVEQMCLDDGERCLGWAQDQACVAGDCANDGINACAITECPAVPASVRPLAQTPTTNTCAQTPVDGFMDYQIAEVESSTLTIDGREVAGCWLVDFGVTCTPYIIGVQAMVVTSACNADCGSSCTQCGDTTKDATALVFVSAEPELEGFRLRIAIDLMFGSTTGAGTSMTPRQQLRYMLVCRPACGAAGWNLAVGGFSFN